MTRKLSRRRFLQLAGSGAGVAALAADVPGVLAAPARTPRKSFRAQEQAANKRGMRLEIGNVPITKIQFGAKTAIAGGVLTVNKEELTAYLLEDPRLGNVELDVANPGESTRIVRIWNEFQPRARTGARKGQFPWPGALGAGTDAGDGSLNVLQDTAVLVVNPSNLEALPRLSPTAPDNAGSSAQMNSEDGGFYAKFHNLVVMAYPSREVDYAPKVVEGIITIRERDDFMAALAVAGMRAAAYLGNAAVDLEPATTEVYELPPVSAAGEGMDDLPKIAFVLNLGNSNCPWTSPAFGTNTTVPQLYGEDGNFAMPMVVHPNEVLDGCAMVLNPVGGQSAFGYGSLPYIKELYARHGKDICFVGCVLTANKAEPTQDKRAVAMAARMVSSILGADGALILKNGGGAPQDQIASIAKELMAMGCKAVADPQGSGSIIPTNPEPQIGLISIGGQGAVTLPAVEKVIGFGPSVVEDMRGEMNLSVKDPMQQIGGSFLRTVGDYYPIDDPVKGPAPSKNEEMEKNAANRAIDMALAMIAGEKWQPEIVCTVYESIKASPGIKDPSKAKIAIISSTGLCRRDDETRFAPSRALDGRFSAYSIKGVQTLPAALWEVNHGGYREDWAREDPERLIPLSTWRELEREGRIGQVNDTMYCFSGLANFYLGMMKVAQGMIPMLKEDGIEAAIMTAT